jgi:hypothetical protein
MTARAGEAPVPGVDKLRETRVLKRTHGRMTTYRHARTGTWPINQCIPLTSPTILMSRGGFGRLERGEAGLGNDRLAGHSSIWERRDGGAGGLELIRLTTALSEWLQIGGVLCSSGHLRFCQYM